MVTKNVWLIFIIGYNTSSKIKYRTSGARNNANGVWKMARDTLLSVESKNIEYKVTLPDKSEKYMKTIVAFANTQGGKLIVGVENSLLYFLQSPL